MIPVKTEKEEVFLKTELEYFGNKRKQCRKSTVCSWTQSRVQSKGREVTGVAFGEGKNILQETQGFTGSASARRKTLQGEMICISCGSGRIYSLCLPSKDLQLKLVSLVCISGSCARQDHPTLRSFVLKLVSKLFLLAVWLCGNLVLMAVPSTQQF